MRQCVSRVIDRILETLTADSLRARWWRRCKKPPFACQVGRFEVKEVWVVGDGTSRNDGKKRPRLEVVNAAKRAIEGEIVR